MAKKMKKLLALVLTIAMVLSFMSVGAFAAGEAENLACTKEEHVHTYECKTLDCDKTEDLTCELHVHGEECKHVHDETCYTTVVCTETAPEHTHTYPDCYDTATATCGKEAGVDLDCGEESDHTHVADCYVAHEHGESCYINPVVCTKEEHTHGVGCYYVAQVGETLYTSFAEAVAAANAAENGATITLLANVELGEKLTIKKNITIEGAHTINRTTAGTLFAVDKNATLTLDGGVTIDGGNNWTFDSEGYYADMEACVFDGPSSNSKRTYSTSAEGGIVATAAMITISGTNGAVVMNNATIQNNWADNHNGGALFSVPAGATLTMNDGALIQHIRGSVAGQIKGTWTMNGGKIDGVHGHNTNGALVDLRGGVVNIDGGEITNVTLLGLNENGSGMLAQVYGESSKLNINGGDIYGNASFSPGGGWGAVVYLNSGGDFTMTGGTIRDTKSDLCTAIAVNEATDIDLIAGEIEVSESYKNNYNSLIYGDITVGQNMKISGGLVRICGKEDQGFVVDGTISSDLQLRTKAIVSGTGTVTGDVVIQADPWSGSDGGVTIIGGNWLGNVITVDSVGTDASLTVLGDAVIDGDMICVFDSVPSGDYTDAIEAATAQGNSYKHKGGTVNSPVLFYHRLTEEQKQAIVVTYDYNGGLDAWGWSGVQVTGASPLTHVHPAPTKNGVELAGWTLDGVDYSAETTATSITLVAKWAEPVAMIVETGEEYLTLTEAVADANALGTATIQMLKSIDFDSDAALAINGDVTIIGEHTISRGDYTGTMFSVAKNATLTLDGGLVLDGDNNWAFDKATYDTHLNEGYVQANTSAYVTSEQNAPIATADMIIVSGSVVMNSATIKNNMGTSGNGVFCVNANATLTMNSGATVTHCTQPNSSVVASVASGAVWTINDGALISDNHGGSNGGVCRVDSGKVVMNGGEVKNNTGVNSNGSFVMVYGSGSIFEMNGGTICSNSSVGGTNNGRNAPVYLHAYSTMNMTGGTICHNIGWSRGGIDTRSGIGAPTLNINRVDQVFDENGVYAGENFEDAYTPENHPCIVDNVSLNGNATHDVGYSQNYGTWWVTGGIYTQDVDEFCAKGYVCIPYADSARTDDYIVVPGYRVSYYKVETQTVTNAETGEEQTETVTTLVHKEVLPLPQDKFYDEVTLSAAPYYYLDSENGIIIKDWYTDVAMTEQYNFSTGVTGDIDLYGAWEDVSTYTVTYENFNGSVLQETTAVTGDAVPEYSGRMEPIRFPSGNYYYTFSGWELTEGTLGVDGTVGITNLVYTATFDAHEIVIEDIITPIIPGGNGGTGNNETIIDDEQVPLAGVPAAFREDHIAYIIGRDDGLVHPEANITRAEVATIFYRLLNDETREMYTTSVNYFTDVNEGDWYNTAVSTLNAMGIIYGRSAEIFDPNAYITRAEFAAIAARFDPTASTEGGFFTDIADNWAETEINMAANNGWVEGYNGLFRPNDNITRAEAMTMVNRVLLRMPESVEDLLNGMIVWADNMDPNKWYYLAVQEATNGHDYERKENEYEYWTALQEVPDWAALEY